MKNKKIKKTFKIQSEISSVSTWSQESETRLQEFMCQAVGKHTDAYLKNLAMTVVQLKAMTEITAMQSDLLKEKAEIARQTDSIAESKVQIAQARRQLTLEIKKNAEIRESLLQERKISAEMKNPDQAQVLSIQDVVKVMKKVVVKKTLLNAGRRRG